MLGTVVHTLKVPDGPEKRHLGASGPQSHHLGFKRPGQLSNQCK